MKARRYLAGATLAGAMMFGTISPAFAAHQDTQQDGLVNVVVGDVTVLQDVNVAAVVGLAAVVCPAVDVNVAALFAAVDGSHNRKAVICRQDDGDKVRIVQN